MSAWILGSEIAGSLGLQDFEFVQEHVLRGLIPYNHQGQPYTPSDVVSQVIAELEEELAQHDDLAWSLSGNDREEIIANRIIPLQKRIQSYLDYRQSLTDATWNGFILPDEHELSARFIGALLNSYYHRDEVYKRLSPQSEPVPDQEPVQPANADELRHFVFKELLTLRAMAGRPLCVECARGWAEDLAIYDDFFEAQRDLMVAIHMPEVAAGTLQ